MASKHLLGACITALTTTIATLAMLVLGSGCAPQLVIQLETDPALQNPPTFVKFQFGERLNRPEVYEFGPFDVNAIPDEEFAPVEPGVEFFIDVIGCPNGDPRECLTADKFNARGCTPYMTLGRDEVSATVKIIVKGAIEGDAECPPPP